MTDNELISLLKKHCDTRSMAKQLLDKAFPPKWSQARTDAEQFLFKELKVGKNNRTRLSHLISRAEKQGINYRTLRRAAIGLIGQKTEGFGKQRRAYWWLLRR